MEPVADQTWWNRAVLKANADQVDFIDAPGHPPYRARLPTKAGKRTQPPDIPRTSSDQSRQTHAAAGKVQRSSVYLATATREKSRNEAGKCRGLDRGGLCQS